MSINGEQVNVVREINRLRRDIKGKTNVIEQNVLAMTKIATVIRLGESTKNGLKKIEKYKNANQKLFEEINQLFREMNSLIPQTEFQFKKKEQAVKNYLDSLSEAHNKCEKYCKEFEKSTESQEESKICEYHLKSGILRQKIEVLRENMEIMKDFVRRYEEEPYADGIKTKVEEFRRQTRNLTEDVRRSMQIIIQL